MTFTKHRHPRGGLASALVAMALALTGCSGAGDEPATPGATVIRTDLATPITSLDPTNNPYLADNTVIALTSGTLFAFARGSATDTEPVLAASIEPSADLLTQTIKLKPGLTFSDGSPLTAESVVSSLTRVRDTPGPNQTEALAFVDIAATDATTVMITLANPVADLTPVLALPSMGIVAAGPDDADYFSGTPVFSGAYVPDGDVTSASFALVRNERFGGPKPIVARIEFSVIADAVTTATRLQSGDIDFAPSLPEETAAQLSGDTTAVSVSRAATLYLIPNNREGSLFSDIRLRQALAWAIDRAALGRVVYGDQVSVQSGPYPVVADYPMPVEVYPEQDLEKARALLKGTACENGCTFTATYFASAAQAEGRAAIALQQMLAPLGMTVQASPVENQQFIQNGLDGAFDLNVAESGSFNVPSSLSGAYDLQYTQCIYSGCHGDDLQPAIDQLFAATDSAGEQAASATVLEKFLSWTPIIPVAGVVTTYGVRTALDDVIQLQPNALYWIAPED